MSLVRRLIRPWFITTVLCLVYVGIVILSNKGNPIALVTLGTRFSEQSRKPLQKATTVNLITTSLVTPTPLPNFWMFLPTASNAFYFPPSDAYSLSVKPI